MTFTSAFLNEAKERGFIHQGTDLESLDALMASSKITAYLGFDPTADSLHVGHMVGLMFLRLLQKHGHKPIALLGGATAKIGDPTGKDAMRQLLSEDDIANNISALKTTFKRYLNFDSGSYADALLVNNNDWLAPLNYIDFLRDFGRYFSVNRMLTFDSVKLRLEREQPLSFLEFNYMIFQAYDFVELYKKHDCVLQLGGSDQWGNIVSGVDLGRRVLSKPLYGLTAPLITTSSGAKMGKSEAGAVWLDANRLSSYDYWQYWRNTEDLDVGRYLRLFTDIPMDEIKDLEKAEGAALNDVKKILADATTTLAHGKDSLGPIHATAASLFGGGVVDLSSLPTVEINRVDLASLYAEDLFVLSNLCSSKGEARRLIEGRGGKINDEVVLDAKQKFEFSGVSIVKISSGKKKHHVLKLV